MLRSLDNSLPGEAIPRALGVWARSGRETNAASRAARGRSGLYGQQVTMASAIFMVAVFTVAAFTVAAFTMGRNPSYPE